jgi:hypothetical protein
LSIEAQDPLSDWAAEAIGKASSTSTATMAMRWTFLEDVVKNGGTRPPDACDLQLRFA